MSYFSKLFNNILKLVTAAFLSLVVLSVFSLFYYNNGIRQCNKTGATDYTWENRFFSLGYEGFACGVYDEDGFNNAQVCKAGEMDILLMGSSQMNGYNVMPKYSTGYVLNKLFKENGKDKRVYNIGIEGHTFYANVDNLDNALKHYKPKEYVVIQINTVNLEPQKMKEVLDGTRIPSEAFDSGWIYYLQKIPYLRLLYKQFRDYTSTKKDMQYKENDVIINDEYDIKLQKDFLKKLQSICEENSVKIMLAYMPTISFDNAGNMVLAEENDVIERFSHSCADNEIEFVNVGKRFLDAYCENQTVPYGFSNTAIGKGHLNKNGHSIMARSIYDAVLGEKE